MAQRGRRLLQQHRQPVRHLCVHRTLTAGLKCTCPGRRLGQGGHLLLVAARCCRVEGRISCRKTVLLLLLLLGPGEGLLRRCGSGARGGRRLALRLPGLRRRVLGGDGAEEGIGVLGDEACGSSRGGVRGRVGGWEGGFG